MGKNQSRMKRMMIRHLNLFFTDFLHFTPVRIKFFLLFYSASRWSLILRFFPFSLSILDRLLRRNSFGCFFNTSSTGFLYDRQNTHIGNMDQRGCSWVTSMTYGEYLARFYSCSGDRRRGGWIKIKSLMNWSYKAISEWWRRRNMKKEKKVSKSHLAPTQPRIRFFPRVRDISDHFSAKKII